MTKETDGKGVVSNPLEPLTRRVRSDVVVYGVMHQGFVAETGKQFRKVIRHADHLLIEGEPDDISAYVSTARGLSTGISRGYESEAAGIFVSRGKEKNIHALEGPKWSYCEKYGLDGEILFARDMFSYGVQGGGFPLGNVAWTVDAWKKHEQPFFDHVSSEQLAGVVQRINNMMQPSLGRRLFSVLTGERHRFIEGALITLEYIATMRDHEEIVPNSLKLANTLKGSKVVIVGKAHVPNQERAFAGLELEPLLPWEGYVQSLSGQDKKAVATFQSIIRDHKK